MSRKWSQFDPGITVDGRACTLAVAAWAESPDHDFANFITGPVDFTISIPAGSTGSSSVAAGDVGWGTGYAFHFVHDASLNTGTDAHGPFAELAVVCNVPANVDTDGHEWRLQLVATPATAGRTDDIQLFRSNSPSSPARVRC